MGSAVGRIASKMLVSLIVTVVAVYLLVCAALYHFQERLLFFPEVLPPDYAFVFPHAFNEVFLPVDDGTLHALHFKVDAPKGAILYLHGNAGSLRSWGTVAGDFVRLGYDVLIIDYRGYGKSTGSVTAEKVLHDDVAAAYTFMLQHYDEQQIIVYGRSIGTGLAVHLAATQSPKMLILETPYFSLQELATAQFPWVPRFLLKYPLRTNQWIAKVSCPVYLLHGTHDSLIPYAASERLADLIRGEHRLFGIEGGDHNNLSMFPDYHDALATILR